MRLDAEIELTSHCQLKCPFCRTGGVKNKYPDVLRGVMKKETFRNIAEKVPGLGTVFLYN